MNNNDLRQLKYRAVKNAYHDVKLAQKARSWSNEKIEHELGIKLPDKMPKLRKDVTPATKRKKELELKKYQYLRDELIKNNMTKETSSQLASIYKTTSYKQINSVITRYSKSRYEETIKTKPLTEWERYMSYPKSERIKLWSNWAKSGKEYPDELKKLATYFNNKKGLANEHHLGWAIVYQAFINNQDPNKLAKYFTVDNFLPEMYVVEMSAIYKDDVI